MFCPNCGQARQGAERFCVNCGTDLTKAPAQAAPVPQSGITPPAAAPAVVPAAAAAAAPVAAPVAAAPAGDLTGVGGWLLLFCIWITIIDPLFDLRLLQYLRYVSANPALLLNFGLTAYGVFTGIMLWTRNQTALVFLRIYFALVVLLMLVGLGRYFTMARMVGFGFWIVFGWLRAVGFLAIWVSYFRVSKRVRATYGANL